MSTFFIAVHPKGGLCVYKIHSSAELSSLENSLLTTYNVDTIITKYSDILRKHKTEVQTLSDFSFKGLFSKAIVLNRNYIQFIINPYHLSEAKTHYTYNKLTVEYQIRKTKHCAVSEAIVIA